MKLLLVLLSAALACVASAAYAQSRMGGFHGPSPGFHGSHFPNGGFHHFYDGRFHSSFAVFVGAPFFFGAPFFPYSYPYYPASYAPPRQYGYYCPDLGYWPAVQSCPSGWLRVIP
jgi:hypothetical protein